MRPLTVSFSFAGFTWPRYCATLPGGSLPSRLKARKDRMCGPSYRNPEPNSTKGCGFYLGSNGLFELREETRGEEYLWNEGFEGVEAIVYRLPKGRGFIAGYTMGDGMLSWVDAKVFDDLDDAVRRANDEAERFADAQAEDSQRFDDMQQAESDLDCTTHALKDCRALRRMGRRVTEDVIESIQSLREAREALANATAIYEGVV